MHVHAAETYSLETDSRGDGVEDCVCMRKVREASGLYALEVHGLKKERWLTCAVSVLVSVMNELIEIINCFFFFLFFLPPSAL